jgi:hypothetical protein
MSAIAISDGSSVIPMLGQSSPDKLCNNTVADISVSDIYYFVQQEVKRFETAPRN